MPSQPHDTGWDFNRVITLIESDSQDPGSTRLFPHDESTFASSVDSTRDKLEDVHLGSFAKLWERLGLPHDGPLPTISPPETESEDQTDSDNAALPSRQSDDQQAVNEDRLRDEDLVDFGGIDKEIQYHPFARMNRKQRQKARRLAEQERKVDAISKDISQQIENNGERLNGTRDPSQKKKPARKRSAAAAGHQRTQSLSNVATSMKSVTPLATPDSGPTVIAPEAALSLLIPSQGTVKPIGSPAPVQKHCAPKPSAVSLALNPLPSPQQDSCSPKVALPKTPTAVGTPVRQKQFPFPSAYANAAAQPLVSTPTGLVPRTVKPVIVAKTTTQTPVTPQMFQPRMVPRVGPTSQMHPTASPFTPQAVPSASPHTAQPQTLYTRPPPTLNIRPRVDRHFQFFNQLMREFPEDIPWLLSPMQLSNEKTSSEGIHVFVDSSNIMIGFRDMLGECRAPSYDMSFDSLVLLMERRRPVAKRVYAGSHRESAPLPHVTKIVETSKAIGYENIVNEQVLISREDSDKKRFFKDVKRMGWNKAAQLHSGSGSDDPEMVGTPLTPSAPKWVEQGVDEILHLKMCQSMIDTEVPTTMVVATGDGAAAEHSDGFLAQVERALKKGWKVELVSWRQQTNGGYKDKKFRAKWGDQFKIFHLDGFIESLIDTP